jgi:YVTN family beta-propeller protein
VTRRLEISARSTEGSCWCTGWDFRRIIARSPWLSIGSNSVTFIDTATNAVKHVAYVGRAPHEAFFTPDGIEV